MWGVRGSMTQLGQTGAVTSAEAMVCSKGSERPWFQVFLNSSSPSPVRRAATNRS